MHAGYFQSGISSRIISFSSSFGRHSFEFRRVLTAARQQWTLNSDSELDFDGFVTVEFDENGHFAANLAPETMSIEFFFFLTGSSDVNSDSSKLDLTTFFLYLSKITSNLRENYLSRSKTTSEKSYSSKK